MNTMGITVAGLVLCVGLAWLAVQIVIVWMTQD